MPISYYKLYSVYGKPVRGLVNSKINKHVDNGTQAGHHVATSVNHCYENAGTYLPTCIYDILFCNSCKGVNDLIWCELIVTCAPVNSNCTVTFKIPW